MENNKYIRSDLACESAPPVDAPEKGAHYKEYESSGIAISELYVTSGEGEALTGRPRGRYVTVNCGLMRYWEDDKRENVANVLSELIHYFVKDLTGHEADEKTHVLIAGLGNRFITADAIGPQTADRVTVTAHALISGGVLEKLGCSYIYAISPGVLGQTGIEAAQLIKNAVEAVKPDITIAVDALAARSCDRLCATVQLSDSGIHPGSGIGNSRMRIDRESLGCPVIAVGIPTVVDSSTLVYDALERAGIENISPELTSVLENGKSFFVSLKESDVIITGAAEVLSLALNRAFFADI